MYLWLSEICLTAIFTSRKALKFLESCLPHQFYPWSCHQRWRPPLAWKSGQSLCLDAHQEKLLEKLNLDGLRNWSPRNATVARELVLAYHNIFMLDSNELGCSSAVEHEIHKNNSEPFKEQFWHIPPLLLEEVSTLLGDMIEAVVIHPSQTPWCNAVVLVRNKDGTLHFCVDFCHLNVWTKKDSYPLPRSSGEYGQHGPFLFNGFQEQILAGENGTRVTAVYCIHHRKSWFLQVYADAFWLL